MKQQPYHKILAWQEANQFVIEVYRKTETFPKQEMYGLTSQLRRAALSVPTNIVEGRAKQSEKDFTRYLNIAEASLKECAYLLEVSLALKFLDEQTYESLESLRARTDFLLTKYKQSILFPSNSKKPL
ncbi:MAG: S23 ribosomal protein [uncultured bacterium]|nr:MAG: S23 ribosomal protein [uncultured bacterium]